MTTLVPVTVSIVLNRSRTRYGSRSPGGLRSQTGLMVTVRGLPRDLTGRHLLYGYDPEEPVLVLSTSGDALDGTDRSKRPVIVDRRLGVRVNLRRPYSDRVWSPPVGPYRCRATISSFDEDIVIKVYLKGV